MILGGHVFPKTDDPEEYVALHKKAGFQAGCFPFKRGEIMDHDRVMAYKKAFEKENIIIAEVGAWGNNPVSKDPVEAEESVKNTAAKLAIADEVNALCCVNIIGFYDSENPIHPNNFSEDFYAYALDQYRKIIDLVKPKRAKMCFEVYPFNFLNGADAYARFIEDIDRPAAGVHLDPINCVSTISDYFNSGKVMAEAVRKLRPYGIVSLHMKDLFLRPHRPNTELLETRLGTGGLDFKPLYREIINTLPADTPVIIEHLDTEEDYRLAAEAARKIMKEVLEDAV
mgnify:CR=1 FL=1